MKKGTCLLIHITISGDRNVTKIKAKGILEYEDLIMWNIKTKVIPVITRATGTISKSFGQYLNKIPEKHYIKELQKTTHIGHCTHTHTHCGKY
jgi:hypothetical protein